MCRSSSATASKRSCCPSSAVRRGQVDGRQRRDQPGELWSDIAGEFADERVPEGVEQPPDGVAPGRIGHPVDTASPRHQRVGLPGREFLEQTGLADAGLAAHEHERAAGGSHAFEGGRQPAPRVVAPDQMRCALTTRHDRDCAPKPGRSANMCALDHSPRTGRVTNSCSSRAPAHCLQSTDQVGGTRAGGDTPMKKYAYRIAALGGSVMAIVMAGGASLGRR